MILLVGLAVVIVSVPLCGGQLSRLGAVKLRWGPVVLAAIALQVLVINVLPDALPSAIAAALHLATYGLAVAFLVVNRSVPGLWIAGTGGLCNLAAIIANGGVMPASDAARRTAGLPAPRGGHFTNSATVKHPKLLFLGDIFAIPKSWPLANVFSIGDVLLIVGAAVLLHRVCGSRLARGQARKSKATLMAPDRS